MTTENQITTDGRTREARPSSPNPPAKRPSRMGAVSTGRLKEPLRVLVYGPEGVGKTTLAVTAPNSILVDADGGSGKLVTKRYTWSDEPDGHVPRHYEDILAACQDFAENDWPYSTIVFDTADKIERLMMSFICRRESGKKSQLNKDGRPVENIEAFGYGKGWSLVLDEWIALCRRFDWIRLHRRKNVVIVGHVGLQTIRNPSGDDYDRFMPRIYKTAAAFLKEWSDIVAYYTFDDVAMKDEGDARARGISTGKRLIHLERTAAFDAKTRIPMPDEIEVDEIDPWGPFARAIVAGQSMSVDDIKRAIYTEVHRVGDPELPAKVDTAVRPLGEGDIEALSRYLNALRRRRAWSPPEVTT